MFWVLVTGLWAAMLVSPFVLLYLFLPTGRECPRCASETIAIKSWVPRPFRSLGTVRWCMECGWEGVSRNAVVRHPLPTFEVVPDDGGDANEETPWKPEN